MRRTLFLILVLFPSALAIGQPAQVTRVLQTIDFEERRLGNEEELPMNWTKLEGPGLPHYVNGRLSADRARSGSYSFRYDLNGGSLVYRYDPGKIPVRPGAHYHVEVYVQTTVMPNARARLSAYLTDLDGHPLASSLRNSDLYAAKAEDEGWKPLSVDIADDDPRAGWLVIELALLQPQHYSATTLGKRAIFPQDIHGTAWFDDLSVSQVPRVGISTDRPGNIFRRDEPVRLNVLISDRFTDDLAARFVVQDALGRVVFQYSGGSEMANATVMQNGHRKIVVQVPQLPPGWYEVTLVITSQKQRVGERKLTLVCLGDNVETAAADPRFGMIATDLPFEGWSRLPNLLSLLGASRVKLAVWAADSDMDRMDPAAFDQMLVRLNDMHICPTACLIALPPSIISKLRADSGSRKEPARGDVNASSLLQLLKAKRESWQPQLANLVARHANHLDRWQLGADGSDAFVVQKGMREVYDKVYGEFSKLSANPDLAMPWPAWYELTGNLPATLALSVPPSVLPAQLPLYLKEVHAPQGHNVSVSLQVLPRETYGRDLQIRDLAQRVIYAVAADVKRIDLPLPYSLQRQDEDMVDRPDELLMVIRTLLTQLNGAVFQGNVPVGAGIESFLFDRNGQGVMALWNTGHDAGVKSLAINLGVNPQRIDVWGNVTPLLHDNSQHENVKVDLDAESMPVFITGIDSPLLQLRASTGFDHPMLESSFRQHTRKIHFKNAYKQSISGTLQLKAPPGWTIIPSAINWSLNPGETFDRPLTIEFPYNSVAGSKVIDAVFTVQADRASTFSMPLTLQLGLSDVGMQAIAVREGKDVIVQQIIQNYGDKPINYTAFVVFPGQQRQERLVSDLGPGNTTIKRYRFENATITPGMKVRLGLKEIEGTRILNDEIDIQ